MGAPAAADRDRAVSVTPPRLGCDERGFTLIEVLATILVLSIGLFAMLPLIENGNQVTSSNLNREAANNAARQVLETARTTDFTKLTTTTAASTLQTAVAPPTSRHVTPLANGGGWTMDGRGTSPASRLTVRVTSCVASSSGAGAVIDSTDTFCPDVSGASSGSSTTTTTTGTSGACKVAVSGNQSIGLMVQLLSSTTLSACAGDALTNAVCSTLGPTYPLNSLLGTLVGQSGVANIALAPLNGGNQVVDLALCANSTSSSTTTTTTAPRISRLVTTTVSWGTGSGARQVRESTLVPEPS